MDSPMEVKGHTGTVRFDGRMITIVRKGFLARASVGKGEKQIPLAHVTAVQFKDAGPVMNGFIQFTIGGGNERRSRFGHQTSDATKDENSVLFTRRQREDFAALRDAVQAALAEAHQPTASSASSAAPAGGIPEQIGKLAELRDAGVLTEAEFDTKKRELLDRM